MLKNIFLALTMLIVASTAVAADNQNPLSVHVLNTQDGLPGRNVEVTLERKENSHWLMLRTARTNEQGRIPDLYPKDTPLKKGIYKVTFHTGEWLQQQKTSTFFPEIPVVFSVDGSLTHYHIPLLLSPYGYSTYRGN